MKDFLYNLHVRDQPLIMSNPGFQYPPGENFVGMSRSNPIHRDVGVDHWYNILLLRVLVNLIPDCISLLESRFIFRYMKGKNLIGMIMLLLLDFVATSIISLSFLVLT